MFEIIKKEVFTEDIKSYVLNAPRIAKKAQPGQYVVVLQGETHERIPLTIADFDSDAGSITIVFQEVGKGTYDLGTLSEGDALRGVIGPLGTPSEIEGVKKAVCVGGGIGIAPVYPIAKALFNQGAHVISIIGARSADLLIFEERMKAVSHEIIVTTDDGTKGRKALVTEPLKEVLDRGASEVDLVMAIGPGVMMKFVARTTEPYGVKTMASLNAIMVDATGMCGACRCEVGGVTKFSCVDGPEFDAHAVDFDLLMARQKMYLEEERKALDLYLEKTGGRHHGR